MDLTTLDTRNPICALNTCEAFAGRATRKELILSGELGLATSWLFATFCSSTNPSSTASSAESYETAKMPRKRRRRSLQFR